MKNLMILFFALFAFSAVAQVEVIANPVSLTIVSTSETEYRIGRGPLVGDLPKILLLIVRFPSTNSGTIQLSSYGDTSSSPAYSNTNYPNGILITIKNSLYVKASSAGDKIEIIY